MPVLLDTDFSPDVDDVGALALLHAYADQSEAEILGVVISSGDPYAARAVSTVNTYYGRPAIPIGVPKQPTVMTESPYTRPLALEFPNALGDQQPPDAVTVYREVLAAQPDHNVTIVCIGFLNNLRDLLSSAGDASSALRGLELVQAKVARVVMMGGHFPDSAAHPAGAEYNFVMDASSTCAVIGDWPTPIIFSGFELGVDIITGVSLQEQTSPDSPVRAAYQHYTGGAGRNSWDLVTVQYAVQGSASGYALVTGGSVEVNQKGQNRWMPSAASKPHAYLTRTAPIAAIENEIDRLLVQPPVLVRRESNGIGSD